MPSHEDINNVQESADKFGHITEIGSVTCHYNDCVFMKQCLRAGRKLDFPILADSDYGAACFWRNFQFSNRLSDSLAAWLDWKLISP